MADGTTIEIRQGTAVLFGYGISIRIDRGHLSIEDGIGKDRRTTRLPRVGHGLKRLVLIGSDGMVSLSALRWLADQDAAFVMLDRDGSVLATTGPVSPSDARLRRAQALAYNNEIAVKITRELIHQKLQGQEHVARHKLNDVRVADSIRAIASSLAEANSVPAIRLVESQAGALYWSAWHKVPVRFPRNDLRRVPDHWRVFGTRKSPLSGSPRYASNPPNAILNYLYAVLESEARLAAAAMGLDPGLGVMHVDAPHRDSLASDLMEPVRPKIDAYVLDLIQDQFLKRSWLFEQRDGNCRLMAPFAVRLAETAPTWRREVAPLAEWLAKFLWSMLNRPGYERAPATRLTQQTKREIRGRAKLPTVPTPALEQLCATCGAQIRKGCTYCAVCVVDASREQLRQDAKKGRVTAHSDEAQEKRRATKRRHDRERRGWLPSSLPSWLTTEAYLERILPRLAEISNTTVANTLGISLPFAADIRSGRRRPHPRHWQALAQLVGVSSQAS